MLSVDEKIGRLIDAAQQRAGRNALLVVLTADHGVARRPEDNAADGLPGGRYEARDERRAVEEALDAAFGAGDYVVGSGEMSMYLSRAPYAAAVAAGATPPAPVSRAAMEQVAAATLRQLPKVARVYTRTELESPLFGGDRIDQRVRNGFNALGSGDVIVVHEPGWMNRPAGTTHGSPWAYDSHVPLIFWGPGSLVEPGRYHGVVAIHDIAATLATLLNIALPSGSMGRTLDEMLP
jgi:arylsulfatase A-like enzyme